MYAIDTQEDVDAYFSYLVEIMPHRIRDLIENANSDLYSGPLYFDADGDECSCFDEGAVPFDFKSAVSEIGDWIDENVEDVRVTMIDIDENDEEVEWEERIEGSAEEIKRRLLGRELCRYV